MPLTYLLEHANFEESPVIMLGADTMYFGVIPIKFKVTPVINRKTTINSADFFKNISQIDFHGLYLFLVRLYRRLEKIMY